MKIGDRIKTIEKFKFESILFKNGEKGTVNQIERNDFIRIAWDRNLIWTIPIKYIKKLSCFEELVE